MNKTCLFMCLLLLISSSILGFTQENKDTLKVLFVGNSYTNTQNMPQIVSLISDQTSTKLKYI